MSGERSGPVREAAATDHELESCRRELAIARAQLQEAQDHLSLFAGQVSHDLRTPLTAVLATSEMLAGEPAVTEDEDLTWMTQGIVRAAQRMDRMVEQMLDYAREGGAPVVEETDLDQVLAVVLEDLAPVLSGSGATVLADPLPTLTADPVQLRTVLANLVSNSVRFARPGSPPSIRVRAQRLAGRWRVTVADDGCGVPEERQAGMFVLFGRVDKRTGGSGIGLATVKRYVEAHGGSVGMATPAGGGLEVWFDLPG